MPFGDVASPEKLHGFFLKQVNPEAVAAVVAEPVLGEGGFIAPPPGYFQELTKICRDKCFRYLDISQSKKMNLGAG